VYEPDQFLDRSDFYQTPSTVTASVYFKKIEKTRAKVLFGNQSVDLDLPTSDNKRFTRTWPLFGSIDPEKSSYVILGTKLELKLAKTDGTSWPALGTWCIFGKLEKHIYLRTL
jgi:hypothetical protein